jgi:hypothetical protein
MDNRLPAPNDPQRPGEREPQVVWLPFPFPDNIRIRNDLYDWLRQNKARILKYAFSVGQRQIVNLCDMNSTCFLTKYRLLLPPDIWPGDIIEAVLEEVDDRNVEEMLGNDNKPPPLKRSTVGRLPFLVPLKI